MPKKALVNIIFGILLLLVGSLFYIFSQLVATA